LHHGLEGIVLEALASDQHIFSRLKAGSPIGMQAVPTKREKAGDLLPQLAGLSRAGNHFVEITYGASEIAT
jgi:hypothetical protein